MLIRSEIADTNKIILLLIFDNIQYHSIVEKKLKIKIFCTIMYRFVLCIDVISILPFWQKRRDCKNFIYFENHYNTQRINTFYLIG